MKNSFSKSVVRAFSLFVLLLSVLSFFGCSSSPKLNAEEISDQCDVIIEVRHMGETLSMMVGKTFYLNSAQAASSRLFPMQVTVRDPENVEHVTPTRTIVSEENFIEFLRLCVPTPVIFGIVFDSSVKNEMGFDEAEVLEKIKAVTSKIDGGSAYLFHGESGVWKDVQKLY